MMNLDLNLLRVLDVLLDERSVTRAGVRLGLTQSAVSHALNRLREMLGDDLLVRGPGGMRATARALELGPQVRAALALLQAALASPDFDPPSSERRFIVATGSYASTVLGPVLGNRFVQQAPLAELVLMEPGPDIMNLIDSRQVDFMIGAVLAAPDRFARETLLTEALTWVVSKDAPLARRDRVDLEALAATPHIRIFRPVVQQSDPPRQGFVSRASWEDAGAFETALAARGLQRRIGVTAPDGYTALAMACASHMPALIPRRLTQSPAFKGALKMIEPPYASPPVEITLVYLKDRLAEPPMSWMHGLLRAAARAV